MKIDILTLFPEMFTPLFSSIMGRATKDNKIEINVINIRDYSKDKHKKCDDYTFGGGPGMLMMPQPIYDAIVSIDGYKNAHKIYMSPKGKTFNQEMSKTLAKSYEHIIILCGHYEGVDQRILDTLIDEEIKQIINSFVFDENTLNVCILIENNYLKAFVNYSNKFVDVPVENAVDENVLNVTKGNLNRILEIYNNI